jgi:protein tyrosine phosphatase type 4A
MCALSGLGRAPVLVALALIESGLEPFDAIDKIRKLRKGAINHRQMTFLEKYKRQDLIKPVSCAACVIA